MSVPLPGELVMWAAHREDEHGPWQGTGLSNYQSPGLIATTWTPRQGGLLDRNVISETGTLLPSPSLGPNTEQSPDSTSVKTAHRATQAVPALNHTQYGPALGLETIVMLKQKVTNFCFVIVYTEHVSVF